jgi:DNA-binding NtrC family response regulator
VHPALFALLRTYSFPGNVRELEAMVFDAVTRHKGAVLSLQSFKGAIGAASMDNEPESSAPSAVLTFPEQLPTLDQTEEALIDEALTRAGGNQGAAPSLLGISSQALNKRLQPPRQSLTAFHATRCAMRRVPSLHRPFIIASLGVSDAASDD